MRCLLLLLSALTILALAIPGDTVLGQGSTGNARLVFQATVPGSRESKFPDVAGFASTVHISSNINRADAVLWSKGDTATDFGSPTSLGDAPGQPDFSPTTVATGADGAIHFAWINQETRTVYYRYRAPGAGWGPQRTVFTVSSDIPVSPDIEVASDGAVLITWRVPDRPASVARSTNNGASWSSPIVVGERAVINAPALATGPNGAAAVTFTAGERDLLQIYAAIWNGSTFVPQRVSPLNSNYANPTATYDANGTLYVAYRGNDTSGGNSGAFVAAYQGNNQWQITRVVGAADYNDRVNIRSDRSGNMHLAWTANAGAGLRVYYSVRPAGTSAFTAPVDASNEAGTVFNASLGTTVSDAAYAHVVSELFTGGTSFVRYHLFAAAAGALVGAQPVIEDGDEISERKASVTVSFTNIQGQPTRVRWRWNAEPTDTANDSNGWQPFTNPINVPLPESILDDAPCSPERLFVQVQEADGDTSSSQSDDITIDTGINAALIVTNPYSNRKAPRFTPALLADVGTGGASDGDPGYTRDPIYYLQVQGVNECSGLEDVAAGRSTTTIARAITITDNSFANVLGYPGAMSQGPNQLIIRVGDRAGNFTDYNQSLIYDPVKPTLDDNSPGSVTVSSDPRATILTTLTFAGINVTDNLYPGRGYWGVWIAVSRTESASPATDPALRWTPVQAPGSTDDFTIRNFSLATNLNGALEPGAYYLYVRFLDGAGNATDGVLTASVTLTQVTLPTASLPLVRGR